MEYEIVILEEKLAAGLKTRTNNLSPDMGQKIGGLWKHFFEEGIYAQISGKADAKTMGLYTNYAGTEKDDYDMYVCCRITEQMTQPNGVENFRIPGGKYARFIVTGNMVTAVQEFWCKLWKMNLDRKFTCDFEEYQPCENGDMEHSEIHIYISLNE